MEFYKVRFDVIYKTEDMTKEKLFREISRYAEKNIISNSSDTLHTQLKLREDIGKTVIEEGVALPHIESDCILNSSIILVNLKEGISNWSDASNPIYLVIFLMIKKGETIETLKEVQTFVRYLADEEVLHSIMEQKEEEKIEDYIKGI